MTAVSAHALIAGLQASRFNQQLSRYKARGDTLAQKPQSTNWLIRILGSAALAGVLAIAGLVWMVFSDRADQRTAEDQLANQATQIAKQDVQIELLAEQNRLQAEQVAIAAERAAIEDQLRTPISPDDADFGPTATALAIQAGRIEATKQAIEAKQQQVAATQTAIVPQSGDEHFTGWVVCWHGRDGFEYLIAYPEHAVKQGIDMNFGLTNAQGRYFEANDSLKMCYANSVWYGYPDPNTWFPSVSYIRLLDGEIQVCSDSPGCKGEKWIMYPEGNFPSNAPELQAPNGTDIHILASEASK